MMNGMVMDQLILFHKPNKKVSSEKMMDYLIPQIKHAIKFSLGINSPQATREEANSQPLTSLRRNKSSEFSRMIKEAKHLGLALGIPCLDGYYYSLPQENSTLSSTCTSKSVMPWPHD
jgi:hypothetical protein